MVRHRDESHEAGRMGDSSEDPLDPGESDSADSVHLCVRCVCLMNAPLFLDDHPLHAISPIELELPRSTVAAGRVARGSDPSRTGSRLTPARIQPRNVSSYAPARFLSSARRADHRVRLHLVSMPPEDPAFPPGRSSVKREMAKRLWAVLVYQDVRVSLNSLVQTEVLELM